VKAAPLQLRAAYAVCRSITRASAKNFYYGFLVLPRRKRDALCAVYAFMRKADDISDDPGLSDRDKRARLEAWMEDFHAVDAGKQTDDPVLLALSNAKQRFKIPVHLLEKLVYGTTMDLQDQTAAPAVPGEPLVMYPTFQDLYQYCYHVASVVGLVCICIFGYRHPRAEKLAERTGIAFQLTNIIRDVGEDARRGRIYLPVAELQQFDVKAHEILQGRYSERFTALMRFQAERAERCYAEALALLPAADRATQKPGLMMASIYRTLLREIAHENFQVLHQRIQLTPLRKFWLAWKVQAIGRM
jgi:phytoene synthase